MKLFLPQNIFSKLLEPILPKQIDLIYKPGSLVTRELELTTYGIALIPSLDLLKHQTLFVSAKFGISFDGLLSNSFFYFVKERKKFEKVFLRGDVSMNELLLTKILFEERYSSMVELILDTSAHTEKTKDYLICGDENYANNLFARGISFSDDIADMLELPYVGYVFASQDKEALMNFEKIISLDDEEKIQKESGEIIDLLSLPVAAKEFIKNNLSTLYFDITPNEQDALQELIKLLYYHGIIENIFDIKFI
jgi:hypothetical protein